LEYQNKVRNPSLSNFLLVIFFARTCIHIFSHSKLTSLSESHLSNAVPGNAITALVQSPAIDVVGVGFTSGEISVYDVRLDERLMRMFMEGGIRALGFRAGTYCYLSHCSSDLGAFTSDGQPLLASASSAGHIALWDLNNGGRLLHMIRGAHDGAVTAVEWVPGQPVLVTSGEDNSIKVSPDSDGVVLL
jgi:U3 small nucleolar RNA-associated protein 21